MRRKPLFWLAKAEKAAFVAKANLSDLIKFYIRTDYI